MPSLRRLLLLAVALACLLFNGAAAAGANDEDDEEGSNSIRAGDEEFHKFRKRHYKRVKAGSSYTTVPLLVDEDQHYWRALGQQELHRQLQLQPVVRRARNVILFLGDGMSVATVTAARILKGQRTGSWEHEQLAFERFPYTALLKTYTTDSQVADSAASATAFLCGVKGNLGTIGVDCRVTKENCTAQESRGYQATSILRWFQDAGRSSGLITNMRVTHATPAGAYAHTADREWEDDHEITGDGLDSSSCDDIAEQLILGETGRNLKVIMGGGRRNLQPREAPDVEERGRRGYRRDGVDLIERWREDKRLRGASHAYVWNREDLLDADLENTEYLLGLFAWSHMDYLLDRQHQQDPSLEEMTRAAIKVLSRDPEGYFLMVEGGLIDHGHHGNKARKALTETLELEAAVQAAVDVTRGTDTLIVVTADHGHSMTVNGYPGRHTDILGFADLSNVDYLPYHTLLYGNGPGYRQPGARGRDNPSGDDTHGPNYRQPAAVPESSSAHSGDDVALWAVGPHAHLFTGTHDQVYVAHAMAYAACVGDGVTFCRKGGGGWNAAPDSGRKEDNFDDGALFGNFENGENFGNVGNFGNGENFGNGGGNFGNGGQSLGNDWGTADDSDVNWNGGNVGNPDSNFASLNNITADQSLINRNSVVNKGKKLLGRRTNAVISNNNNNKNGNHSSSRSTNKVITAGAVNNNSSSSSNISNRRTAAATAAVAAGGGGVGKSVAERSRSRWASRRGRWRAT